MPTPMPAPGTVDPNRPDEAEAHLMARGVATAVRGPDGLTPLQKDLISSVIGAMTGFEIDADAAEAAPIGPEAFASALAHRDEVTRSRILQGMILDALVLVPLPPEVERRIDTYAFEMGVTDAMLSVTRRLSQGHLGLAAADFERNGYTSDWNADRAERLGLRDAAADAWSQSEYDPELAQRWRDLGRLPRATIGRKVYDFYVARGFSFPGEPGSAPPLLAQHDWVHVLADYGSTVDNEIEVFGFIARANDHPSGFSLLAMVVNLFETGYMSDGARFFEADRGHLSQAGMAPRLADAMLRGALCQGSHDFLDVDWFAIADTDLEEVRAHYGIVPKSEKALGHGSRGPFEAGGISPFQYEAGQRRAAERAQPYDSFGATPPD